MKLFKLCLPLLVVFLGGCGITETGKIDYRSGQKTTPLVVPPDLTQLSKETRYAVVNGSVSASNAQAAPDPSKSAIELGAAGGGGRACARDDGVGTPGLTRMRGPVIFFVLWILWILWILWPRFGWDHETRVNQGTVAV